jgi:hypothetical protein
MVSASKVTAMRKILYPDLTASSRQRLSSARRALSSVFNFLSGWRSTPGAIPATCQLGRLNSTTAINDAGYPIPNACFTGFAP